MGHASKRDSISGYQEIGVDSEDEVICFEFFAQGVSYETEKLAVENYNSGNNRNPGRFAIIAYPANYPSSGRMTFIINESGSVYQKETYGDVPDKFPSDPYTEGWYPIY